MRRLVLTVGLLSAFTMANGNARPRTIRFTATAYSNRGTTASGKKAQRKFAAADPSVLPLGSKVRVEGAGPHSGTYTVADTGGKVKGRKIDLFIPSAAAAKEFGKKPVDVKVISKSPPQEKLFSTK